MKISELAKPLVLGLTLSLGAFGCKHTPPKPIHFGGANTGTKDAAENVGPGGKLGGDEKTDGLSSVTGDQIASGLASTRNHSGWTPDAKTLENDTVHFAYDSTVIRPNEKSKVAAVADYLKSNPEKAVEIDGHCDERGTDEYNRSLGERRALALREELARLGVDPSRVDTVSFGRDRPVDTGHSEASHSKNRRGEFVVLTSPK